MNMKIQRLSSKNMPIDCSDRSNFFNRVKAEHLFVSIDECFRYLEYIVNKNKFNNDDLFFTNPENTPILYANIIDEAVCALVYELYMLAYKRDQDAIGYIRVRLDEFMNNIIHERDKSTSDQKKILLNALWEFLHNVQIIANPTDHIEELVYGDLAKYYYNLMFTTYKYLFNLGRERDYCYDSMNVYAKYISELNIEVTPLGRKE